LVPSGDIGKGDGFCPIVPTRIAPTAAPEFSCGPLDAFHTTLMADVNQFWGANVQACACGPDFPSGCEGAFSLMTKGQIYIGVDFVNGLGLSGSAMPAQYVYAHEFGHEIEGHFNALAPTTQQKELTADCLAGYYLGSLVCRGLATAFDIRTTLATACIIADGTGDPIEDRDTHGTCEQRATSVAVGIDAYLAGLPPLAACAL
jgi:predicted metalloprotease